MVAIIQQGIFIRTDINNASGIAQRECSITAARRYQCKAISCCRAGPRVRHEYFEITCCLTDDVELIALMISHIGTHIKLPFPDRVLVVNVMKFSALAVTDERVTGSAIIITFAPDIARLAKLRRVFWFVVVISAMMVHALFSSETSAWLVSTAPCVLKEAPSETTTLPTNIAGA